MNMRLGVKDGFGRVLTYALLGAWTLFAFYAVGWIILASVSTTREIFTNHLLQGGPQWQNYIKAFTTHNLGLYFFNSTYYVITALILIILISAPAAYVLSRFEFA